jgi:hypothetical protein
MGMHEITNVFTTICQKHFSFYMCLIFGIQHVNGSIWEDFCKIILYEEKGYDANDKAYAHEPEIFCI